MRLSLVVAITLGSPIAVATARPDCQGEAKALRTHLTAEAHRADLWSTAWAFVFLAATSGQLVAANAEINPLGDFDAAFEEQLYVGAVKASLGLASKLVLPLRLSIPAPTGDDCADARTLRKAIAVAADKERKSIWLTLIGGTAINLAGTIWLWARHDLKTGLLSFASGAPVGPISALTQPRGSMRFEKKQRVSWVVGLGWIGGTF
jgi:hypothetical protein